MKNGKRYLFLTGVLLVLFSACTAWGLPYYQLRDVSGEKDGHTVAGSQWFATVYEYRWVDGSWFSYQDTHGGEAPVVPMTTSADLLFDFNSVYLEDPQHQTLFGDSSSFDPIESAYLVIKEGKGELKIRFGNDYARHTPYGAQDAMQDVLLAVPEYSTRVSPSRPQLVSRGDWLNTELNLQAYSPQLYGSTLGYLTFRQSASFDTGFTGYRESIKIPLVVANVYDGLASDSGNALYFDMSISDGTDIVTRKYFRWGVDQDLSHFLGTFFMIQNAGSSLPGYTLQTRITNRTGTRYRNQRYDTIGGSGYKDITPYFWMYDVAPDLYGTLPSNFQLDPQSQIAPGLITAYLTSLDMGHGSSESFRLYPFRDAIAPRDLRLTFRKVGGLTSYGTVSASGTRPAWTVTGFNMTFADVADNAANTAKEIANYTGGNPVMPETGFVFTGASDRYIKADAFNSVQVSAGVPEGLFVVSSDKALLPVKIRLRVSRKEAPIVSIWNSLLNSENIVETLANTCTIWVRSDSTAEKDMNLFTTLRNRGYAPDKCIQGFISGDYLYLDFIVLLADAVSQNSGKTAFCQVIKDDDVPYILIGDGAEDKEWNLSFYVAPQNSSPIPPIPPTPEGSGGGGCNSGFLFFALPLLIGLKRNQKL